MASNNVRLNRSQ